MKTISLVFFGMLLAGNSIEAQTRIQPTNELAAWGPWSPRDEIAPAFSTDKRGGRQGKSALKIQTHAQSDFGAFKRRFDEISANQGYRFTAWYRAKNVPQERHSIIPRLEWFDNKGKSLRPPEYAIDVAREKDWTKVELVTSAPEAASAVDIQLGFGFAPNATIWWDNISLQRDSSAQERTVNAVTIYCRPRGTKSAAESVEQFCRLAEQSSSKKPDIVCLPEGITVVGTSKTYAEVSEPVPGPTTERLGRLARQLHSYIVGGLYEREGKIVYNTAVLMNREGKLAGTYRKTHLPREEWEAGITPGDSYPVFDTDFGKIGLMICWDLQFPEPCRAMALKGAELVLLPIWGGSEVLARARAIENHIFLVTSSYDMNTFIVDPAGKVAAEASKDQPIAAATLQLDRKIYQPWLGDMKNRTWKERRADIPVEPRRP